MNKISVNYLSQTEQNQLSHIPLLELAQSKQILNLFQDQPYFIKLIDDKIGAIVKVSFKDEIVLVDGVEVNDIKDTESSYNIKRLACLMCFVGKMILDKEVVEGKDTNILGGKNKSRKVKWKRIDNKVYKKKEPKGRSYEKREAEWSVRTHIRNLKNGVKIIINGYSKKFLDK